MLSGVIGIARNVYNLINTNAYFPNNNVKT